LVCRAITAIAASLWTTGIASSRTAYAPNQRGSLARCALASAMAFASCGRCPSGANEPTMSS
jgi:hypothetical protein